MFHLARNAQITKGCFIYLSRFSTDPLESLVQIVRQANEGCTNPDIMQLLNGVEQEHAFIVSKLLKSEGARFLREADKKRKGLKATEF